MVGPDVYCGYFGHGVIVEMSLDLRSEWPMDRVSVVGCPGSGKTTFAAALAERMGTSHLELDSLYHQKDWEPLPDDEFRSAVTSVIGGERWVVDGN